MAEITIKPQNGLSFADIPKGQRVQRKTLITIAEWKSADGESKVREVLGARTEDSSIEFNADIQTSTDILGVTYTDVNKTEPQQSFDPYYLMGGSKLSAYLANAALDNNIDAYNNCFDVYIITTFIVDGTPTESDGKFKCIKHSGCSIIPTSLGGDSYVSMPIEVHYSNKITKGTADKLADDFVFTEDK